MMYSKNMPTAPSSSPPKSAINAELLEVARLEPERIFAYRNTVHQGLTSGEAERRLVLHGRNELKTQQPPHWYERLWANMRDPLNALLIVLGIISFATGDVKATVIIGVMLVLSIVLRLIQEERAESAVEKLKAMVHTTGTVMRDGEEREVPLTTVVPGDVVLLSAGDMVPADVRIIESTDCFVNQAALTGESLPVDKHAVALPGASGNPFALSNLCFMGTNVESGTATGVVIATGAKTAFGELASSLSERQEVSAFDRGVGKFTWLMIRFIGVLVPLVFLINGFGKGSWLEAFLFAMAVAVGLTPELLPMIITVNLSKGAMEMSKKKVIVKRLNAMQNMGAMDVLCTDKTGTLTEGKVQLIKYIDIEGKEDDSVLAYAYLNSSLQTGLKNLMDTAVVQHANDAMRHEAARYEKVDEMPFDFQRRRMSVVVQTPAGDHLLICKGAVEEVMAVSSHVLVNGNTNPIDELHHQRKRSVMDTLGTEGFRLVALAMKSVPAAQRVYTDKDESNLTLVGFLGFLDPAKASARDAIKQLQQDGVGIKVLTGDNELVTRKICADVGLVITQEVQGSDIDAVGDEELMKIADRANIFCKLEPAHKVRIIKALQHNGHVVGFLGDGINDAPALKAADVGASVDTAADIARDSSDFILLERSLAVLHVAILEGRKVFGNIVKYIRMTASSNFGNMLSVVGASIFLPFLPMLPLQIIVNNLLYDFSQVTIPTDTVDDDYYKKPRTWHMNVITRFILFLGPVSSLFDYATYGAMLWIFHAWGNPTLFQTGWFVESLISQTLIIHVIRTRKVPFLQSRASRAVTFSSLGIVLIGMWLPYSPLAQTLGFTPLPIGYWFVLVGLLACYFVLAQFVKNIYYRRYERA